MNQNNNILLIATMIVLILSITFMVNISIMGYAALDNITQNDSINNSAQNQTQQQNITCGDNICNGGEDCNTCSQDCGLCQTSTGSLCGNGVCDIDNGEDSTTCPDDCPVNDNSILIIGVVAGAMIAIILLLVYFVKKSPIKMSVKPKEKEEFIPGEEELITYVRQMRSSGYSEVQIKDALTKAGWRIDLIDSVLRKYKK